MLDLCICLVGAGGATVKVLRSDHRSESIVHLENKNYSYTCGGTGDLSRPP